jgi:predicted transcriptional regulator of viral defense system
MYDQLRHAIPFEEFDYQSLLESLRGYAYPRKKITSLLHKEEIIRVKKGLYLFGEGQRRSPYCRELLANLIYGPSCISLEYALHYHGLTPERAETITSVCCGRSRSFTTPIGSFSYRMIPLAAFSLGIDRIELTDGRSFLMAIAEKALADRIMMERGSGITTQKTLLTYLNDNLRIDSEALRILDHETLLVIAAAYRSRRLKILAGVVEKMQMEKHYA